MRETQRNVDENQIQTVCHPWNARPPLWNVPTTFRVVTNHADPLFSCSCGRRIQKDRKRESLCGEPTLAARKWYTRELRIMHSLQEYLCQTTRDLFVKVLELRHESHAFATLAVRFGFARLVAFKNSTSTTVLDMLS